MLGRLLQYPEIAAALSTVIALVVGAHYFPTVRVMATAALIALSLTTLTQRHLDENRVAIWELKHSPYHANFRLAVYFLKIFTAIFIVSCVFDLVDAGEIRPHEWQMPRYRNDFASLFAHNCGVLLACALLALVYGSGALTLVLTWNALNWSESLIPVLVQSAEGDASRLVQVILLLPHLVCEVLAYVLAGMVGVFLGKAIMRYTVLSPEFYRVSRACVVIIAFSLGALLLASYFEVSLVSSSQFSSNEPIRIPRGGLR
jgi:uncharacterized membrane protein SpoIIM required for sporulation